jgi:aryl-alcohol dehydrogenase-like predicted oxidoreductase
MKANSSRRNFLAAGLGLPVAGLGALSPRPSVRSAQPVPKLLPEPEGEIRYRTLGRTGLKVSSVGFGCLVTSDPSVVEKAADVGINHFDTARGYQSGNNERMLGAGLKGKRKDVVVATKTHADSKQGALAQLETSLRELGTDFVDIWYLHAKSEPGQITDELIDAQQTAKKAGKVRFTGVSTHKGHAAVIPALIDNGQIDVLLTTYNFTMDKSMDSLVESAAKAGLGVVAMKVMAGGHRRAERNPKLRETVERDGALLAMLKWVLKNPGVHSTIPSMTDLDQLDENMKAMTESFTDADQKLLTAHLEHIGPLYCRMCGECEGTCPEGLPVADILRYLTYAEGYGQFALGREHFLGLPAEVTSVRCNLCPTCSVQCPFGVRVAERLSRAQELFA